MQLPEIYRQRPIASWTFTIGVLIVLIWGLFGRAVGGGSSSNSQQIALASNMPDPNSQLEAGTAITLANIQAGRDRDALIADAQKTAAVLSVEATLRGLEIELDDRNAERSYNLQSLGIASTERIAVTQEQALSDRYAIAAEIERANIAADRDVDIAMIDSQVAQAQIWGNVQNTASNNARKSSRTSGILGVIGGVLGGIFSDVRLKENLVPLYRDQHGLQWYEYNYTPEAARLDSRIVSGRKYVGILAQDLHLTPYVNAVGNRAGYLTVDYGKLPNEYH